MTKLTDSDLRKSRKTSNKRRAVSAVKSFWSDSQKAEACTTYFLFGGNLTLTGKKLGIPYETLKTWKKSEWWRELENDIRNEERLALSSKLRNLMDASLTVVQDRLENGDWIYDQKEGILRRKPVSMKDAGKLAMDAANLRTKMDIQENHTVSVEHIEDKLQKLANAFSDLAKGKKVGFTSAEDIPFVEEVSNDKENSEGVQSDLREREES